MNALPVAVWLQTEPSLFNSFLIPMVMVFGIFYLLLIRPQNKQRKEHDKMLESVAKGDEVVTTGGMHGSVVGATDEVLTIEIANVKGERVRVKVDRKSVERRTARADGKESS